MPFGPYTDFADCVAKNGSKSNPQAFCAWLHHQITGQWPGELAKDTSLPQEAFDLYLGKYSEALNAGKGEKEAHTGALSELEKAGWVEARRGWTKYLGFNLQAPKMRTVSGVKVFATGSHTDSAGNTRKWAEADLDKIVEAFVANVPAIVPLKAGHTPDAFNSVIAEKLGVPVEVVTGDGGKGQIALGRMSSLERKGNLLIASFERVPEAIANLIEGGQFSTVSVEIDDKVGDFGPVITAVALLGVEEPAVASATLDRASVFGKPREGAVVLSFTVADDTLQGEFADLKSRLNEWVKGKRGAPIFRAFIAKLNEMFEQMTGGHKHQSNLPVPPEVVQLAQAEHAGNVDALIQWAGQVGFDACVTSLTGKPGVTDPVKVCGWLKGQAHQKNSKEDFQTMDIKKLAQLLGLPDTATEEQILAKIAELTKGGAGMLPEAMSKEFSAMKDTVKAQATTIARLEHAERVGKYLKETALFTAVAGKPGDIAESLASLEEKSGEATAKQVLATYQEADKAGKAATQILGTSKKGEKAVAFEDKVQQYSKVNPAVSRADAIKAIMRAEPDLYRESIG